MALSSERWNSFLKARLLLKGRGKRDKSLGIPPDSPRLMVTYLRDRVRNLPSFDLREGREFGPTDPYRLLEQISGQ
ncbi:hypothetical protein CEXT_310921 [Caerostris extrusa]|uniref:Uncharacterized protein n=1 Tax=Caerostris extrusa TaxID=172846 RepID=A0AAV4WY60_CAEEX|nr:hypothetical protein CEXT_310921 [Caerostris extrusa]